MKDLGTRFGSSAWAVPVIYTPEIVYVHTDIEQVKVDAQGKAVTDLYKYHEKQYAPAEYIEQIGKENADLNDQVTASQKQLTDTQMALVDVYELIGGMKS